MADRMAAEIWIGGNLARSLLEEFPISDLTLDWDNSRMPSFTEADILAGRNEDGLLHFADVEAAWGEFQELEGWLREHDLPFRRQSEGKYEHLPELVEFRPDLKGKRRREVCVMTSPEGKPLVVACEVEAITDRMAKLTGKRKRSSARNFQALKKLLHKLILVLPPKLPPLPRFEIVNG